MIKTKVALLNGRLLVLSSQSQSNLKSIQKALIGGKKPAIQKKPRLF